VVTLARTDFPYKDGGVTVLGPEVFVSDDERVISYAGRNYVSQGRFTADNTARKWIGRVLATIGLLTLLALGLAALGVHALVT
jgi:hypothetical protein